MEAQPVPDSDDQRLRIPLSLGTVKEDFDKKGRPCQVFDVIWNPETIEACKKDMLQRQAMIELAFGYIHEKYKKNLSLKYSVPKMQYKGGEVQFQRVRAK